VDLEKREEHFGSNRKKPNTVTPFFKLFFGALDDFMLKLLLVCAVVDLAIETGFATPQDRNTCNDLRISLLLAWIEGIAIFLGVFIVAFVGSWNDWQKEK
jgi:magnesium-transporting ATPase (P-type)